MTKCAPLNKDVFDKRDALLKQIGPLQLAIEHRLDYVLHKAYELCGAKFNSWYIDGAAEGEVGAIDECFINDSISRCEIILYNFNGPNSDDAYCVVLGDSMWDLMEEIPKRWMFEDFEDELVQGRAKFIKQKEDRLAASKARKLKLSSKNKKLVESAKAKLTIEERRALKL